MSKIFGGSKQKSQQSSQSSSQNLAYPGISAGFLSPAIDAYRGGINTLQNGISDFKTYRDNVGADFWKTLGLRKTAGGFSGRGLYNSGATLKGLAGYEDKMESAMYNDWLEQQAKLAALGLQGGGLVSGTGNTSTSTSQGTGSSSSSGGLAGLIGGIMGGGARG